MNETAEYVEALRKIADACSKPFGKDARTARRIAVEALRKWGRPAK